MPFFYLNSDSGTYRDKFPLLKNYSKFYFGFEMEILPSETKKNHLICENNRINMSQGYTPPRRAPRKKLKMPLFGNLGSGNSGQGEQVDWGGKNFTKLVFIVGTLGLLAQMFLPNLWAEKMYDTQSEILDLDLNGSIRKKYTDATNPNDVHYILVVKQKDGTRRKLDLHKADPVFFDQVAVPQRLKKTPGSLDVLVTRFSKLDTTIKIRFLP